MNAEYFRDMLDSLEEQGLILDKIKIQGLLDVGVGDPIIYETDGTVRVSVDKDGNGTFALHLHVE